MVFVRVLRLMATMLSLTQKQSQQQKLTPQQLQYLKLLQLSAIALEQRVKEELELNPLLEEGDVALAERDGAEDGDRTESEIDWDDMMPQGEYEGYSSRQQQKRDDDTPDIPQRAEESLLEQLLTQLRMQSLTDDELALAEEILGNIDADGYLRRDLTEIVEDLNRFIIETGLAHYAPSGHPSHDAFASYDNVLGDQPFGRERLYGARTEDGEDSPETNAELPDEEHADADNGAMVVSGADSSLSSIVKEEVPEETVVQEDKRTIADLSLEEMANLPIEELALILERGTSRTDSSGSAPSPTETVAPHTNGVATAEPVQDETTDSGSEEAILPSPDDIFSVEDAERLLHRIQRLEPPGIGSRNLQESLRVQLEFQEEETPEIILARRILSETFHEFTMKHFEKICRKLECDEDELRDAIDVIVSLNPKPGEGSVAIVGGNYVTPDFTILWQNEEFVILPNDKFIPTLRINANYQEMLGGRGKKQKQGIDRSTRKFLREKLESAKWFIASIHQRRQTMSKIMRAIVELQIEFFRDGPNHLKPMIYKDVAERIGMDISTVCRVVNGKYVQTDYGVFELRYFFSEALETVWGEEVSNKVVKAKIKELIEAENKSRPLSDEAISEQMKALGYNVARRTVAKYREQMNISVARLRRSL